MQCKSCGGHYRLAELSCPYCGTENAVGRVWMKNRTDAEIAFEKERVAAGKRWSPFIYNRVITRVLVVIGALYLLSFLAMVIFAAGSELMRGIRQPKRGEDVMQQCAQLYEEERLGELYRVLNEYDDLLDNSSDEVRNWRYAAQLRTAYDRYLNCKLSFFSMTQEERKKDTFELYYLLSYANHCYTDDPYYTDKISKENEARLESYRDEIRACLKGLLNFTEEEFDEFMSRDYWYSSEMEALETKVRERNGW